MSYLTIIKTLYHEKNRYFSIVLQLVLALFTWSCSNDDGANPQELEAWELEVEQLKAAAAKYIDIEVATNEGFFVLRYI